ASEATKIRGDYLNSFESNNFSINIPEIYIRGFLRAYSSYLKINSEKVVTDLNAHLLGEGKMSKRDNREFLGRMELQRPLIQEDASNAGAINDDDYKEEPEKDKPSFWQNIDKEIAIKIGISAVLALIVILAVIFTINFFVNSDEEPTDIDPILQPLNSGVSQGQSIQMTLIAKGDVSVTVTPEGATRPIYQGSLAQGERFPLDVIGRVRIEWDNGANLAIGIGSEEYGMPSSRVMALINPKSILDRQQEADAGQ
ncbi:MAG: helix-turn-helix domain-containing protein, partial [Verrucomicrobiota bacterium]